MGKKLHLLLIVLLLVINIKAQNQEFTPYNEGTQFVSVEVDGATNRVWAAARYATGNAIVKLEAGQDSAPTVFTTFEGVTPTGTPLKNYFIRDIAIDGDGNVWVGHYGYGSNNVVGGVEKIKSDLSLKHYYAYDAGGGLQTRKVRSIIVDKNNKVWAAQYNHRLIGTPPGAGANTITIWPGTLAFKPRTSFDFDVLGNTYRCAGQPTELPYPRDAFGDFMPDTALRNFQALSSDDTEVWASHWAYETGDDDCTSTHNNIADRILRYSLDGNYIGEFIDTQMSFPTGSTITNICRNNGLGTWVTTYTANSGFSVYKNGSWIHISPADFPNILETGTGFNANAMWKDKNGKVYMGTNNGLIVYNGIGDVDVESSYKKYIKHSFSGTGNIIYDGTMVSENIFGGCSDPNDSRINWIATEGGIMKLKTIEGVELYHVPVYADCISYENDTYYTRCDDKIEFLAELDNDQFVLDRLIPSIASDGTPSTVFRIKTGNPQAYYNASPTSTLMVGSATTLNEITTLDYIKQYGKFTIRKLNDYDFASGMSDTEILNQLTYVDFIYQHPEYIDVADYVTGKNYAEYNFRIVDANMESTYISPVKIAVPPVLIGHGVWSDISSLAEIERYLKANEFQNYLLLKVWRTDGKKAENSFMSDAWVIPGKIRELKKKARENRFSAGKVNVVVHSRGGLYTRGYIEGINPLYLYKFDINSLITLNTPHFGSQGGNFAVDKRIIHYGETDLNTFIDNIIDLATIAAPNGELPVSTLGQLIAGISDAEKVKVEGALHLLVENDNISGVVPPQDPEFISKLNRSDYLTKLDWVPIHTISTEFNPCNSSPVLCNNFSQVDQLPIVYRKALGGYLVLYNAIIFGTNTLPNSVSSLTNYLYDGEKNDFIVPLTSMQGGLGGTRFNTHFGSAYNYAHIDLGPLGTAVTEGTPVLDEVLSLLKSNVYDETGTGKFTQTGISPIKLNYAFLTSLTPANRNINSFLSKVLINRDPAIFDNVLEGGILNYNVYQEDVDRIMITYENENDSGNFTYEIKSQNLAFANVFTYTIPSGYNGELKITAYGFKTGVSGYVKSTVTLNVEVPASVTLQSIHFATQEPVILNQDDYNYTVIGTYSDGIDRILDNVNLTFSIEDSTITSQVDSNTLKADSVGVTLFTASINGLEDTILVKVIENPSLYQTILTSFYGTPNTDNTAIAINWETLREYQNATFVLETSYNTPDNFTEIEQQSGNGTTEIPAQFNFEDTTFGANTLIYYRIKMIDTSSNVTYSSTIEVNLSTLGVEGEDLSSPNLELYPNPAKTNEVTLKLDSKFTDKNAKLELYSLQGKRLSVQTLNVIEGTNSFNLKIGNGLTNGIYLVRITTTSYIKTVKLIIEK